MDGDDHRLEEGRLEAQPICCINDTYVHPRFNLKRSDFGL